jgi:hypothetical protein
MKSNVSQGVGAPFITSREGDNTGLPTIILGFQTGWLILKRVGVA